MDEQIAKMLAVLNASPLALFLSGVAAGIEIRPVVASTSTTTQTTTQTTTK